MSAPLLLHGRIRLVCIPYVFLAENEFIRWRTGGTLSKNGTGTGGTDDINIGNIIVISSSRHMTSLKRPKNIYATDLGFSAVVNYELQHKEDQCAPIFAQ